MIDSKIERYTLLTPRVADVALLAALTGLIDLLRALKIALHPEQTETFAQPDRRVCAPRSLKALH